MKGGISTKIYSNKLLHPPVGSPCVHTKINVQGKTDMPKENSQ